MSKRRTYELANVVIKFGDNDFLENLQSIVLPALLDGSVKGKGEVKSYKFLGLKLAVIGEDQEEAPVLFGRLVKFMTIEAEQEFDENADALIASSKQIPSAPSSFFVITLANHKLALLGETRRSPTLRDLEFCFKRILVKDWRERFTAHMKSQAAEIGLKRIPRDKYDDFYDKAREENPEPSVRITPLPAINQLEEKFAAFAKLTSITIKPMKTNNELPDENAEFLRQYEQQQKKLKSETTSLQIGNSEGLDKEEAEHLTKAAANGNYKVSFRGKARNGNSISGDLDQLSVKIKENIPESESDEDRAVRVFNVMAEALAGGYVVITEAAENLLNRAKEIVTIVNRESQ